jgi:hypothetical protein
MDLSTLRACRRSAVVGAHSKSHNQSQSDVGKWMVAGLGFAPDGAVMLSSGRKPRETDADKQTVAPDGAVVGVGGVPRSRVGL